MIIEERWGRFMAGRYCVKYKESQNTLQKICKLFRMDESDITLKFVVFFLGILIFYFVMKFGNPGNDMTKFVVRYIIWWIAAFAVGITLNRTIWRKALDATAIGDAEDQFLRRNKLNGGTVSTELDFYDDHFDSVMEMKTRSFQYANVVKLLESEDAFAVVVKTEPDSKGSPRAMCGFPKDALEQGSINELRAFLLERCTNMRRKKVKKF